VKKYIENNTLFIVPGVNSHNFSPANAQEAISTHRIEPWKRLNRAAHAHFVEKGTKKVNVCQEIIPLKKYAVTL